MNYAQLTLKMAVSKLTFELSYLSIIPAVRYSILSSAYIEHVYFPIAARNVIASLLLLKMFNKNIYKKEDTFLAL